VSGVKVGSRLKIVSSFEFIRKLRGAASDANISWVEFRSNTSSDSSATSLAWSKSEKEHEPRVTSFKTPDQRSVTNPVYAHIEQS